MKLTSSNKEQGFTLIELMTAIAILAIILVGLLAMLSSFLKVRNNDQTEQGLKTEGNYVLDRVEFLVRNGVTMPDICCDRDSKLCQGKTGQDVLQVKLNDGNSNGRLVLNRISNDVGRVQLETGKNETDPSMLKTYLSSDQVTVSNLSFDCDVQDSRSPVSRATVKISFELSQDKDLLGGGVLVQMPFSRSVAVGNNYSYIFDN